VPSPSPTTTRAVKLKRRPPLTTFDTRLMVTTRSMNSFLGSAPRRPPSFRRPPERSRSPPPVPVPEPVLLRCGAAIRCSFALVRSRWSQGQPALARTFGDGRDTTVVLVARAVEHGDLDAG